MKVIHSDDYQKIKIRAAGNDDAAFFEKLYVAVRRIEFAMLGWDEHQILPVLKMQFDAQTRGYRGQFPNLKEFVVETNGEAVGRLVLTDEMRLVDIAVSPARRNLGIGSFVLKHLLDKADGENKNIFLRVLKTNTEARRLYMRFGFQTTGEDDLYLMMRRHSLPKRKNQISQKEKFRNYECP